MPTTLPVRWRGSDLGRKRGLPRSAAALLLWAIMMVAVTAASHMGNAADFGNCDLVLP